MTNETVDKVIEEVLVPFYTGILRLKVNENCVEEVSFKREPSSFLDPTWSFHITLFNYYDEGEMYAPPKLHIEGEVIDKPVLLCLDNYFEDKDRLTIRHRSYVQTTEGITEISPNSVKDWDIVNFMIETIIRYFYIVTIKGAFVDKKTFKEYLWRPPVT